MAVSKELFNALSSEITAVLESHLSELSDQMEMEGFAWVINWSMGVEIADDVGTSTLRLGSHSRFSAGQCGVLFKALFMDILAPDDDE